MRQQDPKSQKLVGEYQETTVLNPRNQWVSIKREQDSESQKPVGEYQQTTTTS